MTFFKFCNGCGKRIEKAGHFQKYCEKCKVKIKKKAAEKTKRFYKNNGVKK